MEHNNETNQSQINEAKSGNKNVIISVVAIIIVLIATGVYLTLKNEPSKQADQQNIAPTIMQAKDPKTNENNTAKSKDTKANPTAQAPQSAKQQAATNQPTDAPPTNEVKFTLEQAQKATEPIAKKRLGNDLMFIPANDKAVDVSVEEGKKLRTCYLFATIPSGKNEADIAYYFDATTGEIFESNLKSGKMEKIK